MMFACHKSCVFHLGGNLASRSRWSQSMSQAAPSPKVPWPWPIEKLRTLQPAVTWHKCDIVLPSILVNTPKVGLNLKWAQYVYIVLTNSCGLHLVHFVSIWNGCGGPNHQETMRKMIEERCPKRGAIHLNVWFLLGFLGWKSEPHYSWVAFIVLTWRCLLTYTADLTTEGLTKTQHG